MYAVVIPNRYKEVIAPLLDSIEAKIKPKPLIIIIQDGHRDSYGYHGIPYDEEHFCFARAINIGIRAAAGKDIIILNDDCKILEFAFFERLRQMAYIDPQCGILSPLIVGCAGNPVQRWHEMVRYWTPEVDFINVTEPSPVCFPCVYVKRKVFEQIGLMNEQIPGYGYDDHDLCSRARFASWKTMVTQRAIIQHGDGSPALGDGRGRSWATSYMKRWPGIGTPPPPECEGYIKRNFKV
jgi:glycosyltransferase involved in cell wall biosynthesis